MKTISQPTKEIRITALNRAGRTVIPSKNGDGHYTAVDPSKRFNSKVYANDCELVTNRLALKLLIEKGYGCRMSEDGKGAGNVFTAQSITIEIIDRKN